MSKVRCLALAFLLALPRAHFGQLVEKELHRTVAEGDLAKVKAVIARYRNQINSKGRDGDRPIQVAARRGDPAIARELLKAGAILDIESAAALGLSREAAALLKEKPWLAKAPRKPLHQAAARGHLDMVQLLLHHRADPSLDYGYLNVLGPVTPLSEALSSRSFDIARLLCRHAAVEDLLRGKGAAPARKGGRK